MKALIDTDVLIEAAAGFHENSQSHVLLSDIAVDPDFSLWISAVSINNIFNRDHDFNNKEKINEFIQFIKGHFSIIPFRNSTFLKAIANKGMDFEHQAQMASAEEFNVDYIISGGPSNFRNSRIPVLTAAQFLEKRNAGELDQVKGVPFLDLKAQHHQIYNEIDDRITDILSNTGFILGKYVEEFEHGFAELQEAKYCIGVSSGTDALHIALSALGIGPGDAVIVPVNTFIATAEAVSLTGATPVFVDCDEYYNLDTGQLEKLLNGDQKASGKIKAIIPVHLYGQPARMKEIMKLAEEYELKVIEDACQAHLAWYDGQLVGNFGEFGAFSFYPGKNLGAYGEAGALISNNEDLYLKAKMLRQHGEIERYHHNVIGHNYRMEAIQGAVLATKLKYLDEWTRKRQENAQLYNRLLNGVKGIQTPVEIDNAFCVYHLYVIQADDRDGLQRYLQQNGISTGLHYPVPLHLQEAYKELGYKEGDFPMAEKAAKRILSLPMFPELTEAQIRYVCEKIKEHVHRRGAESAEERDLFV